MEREVWDCLEAIGLHSGSIADCAQLSKEIRFFTGMKVSASTLYRMLNPVAQKVAASNYSIAAVLAFLDVVNRTNEQGDIRINGVGKNELQESALYSFVVQEFHRETQGFEDWFTALPIGHWSTGLDQVIIGHALAHVLSQDRQSLSSEWKRRLFLTAQFRTYYSETFVDLNSPQKGYLDVLSLQFEAMNQELVNQKGATALALKESLLFNLSIRAFQSFLMDNAEGLTQFKKYVKSKPFNLIKKDFSKLGILARIRFMCMELLLSKAPEVKEAKLNSIKQELKNHFTLFINPQLREFAYCILMDALLLNSNSVSVTNLLSDIPSPSITFLRGEPSISRMSLYRILFEGNQDERLIEMQEFALSTGGNELVFSKLMVQLAKKLRVGSCRESEVQFLIQQSGFTRFHTLLM